MKKLNCYICDTCRKILWLLPHAPWGAKEKDKHFCNEQCEKGYLEGE